MGYFGLAFVVPKLSSVVASLPKGNDIEEFIHSTWVQRTILAGLPRLVSTLGNATTPRQWRMPSATYPQDHEDIALACILSVCASVAYLDEATALESLNAAFGWSLTAADVRLVNAHRNVEVLIVKPQRGHIIFAFRGTEAAIGGDWMTSFQFKSPTVVKGKTHSW